MRASRALAHPLLVAAAALAVAASQVAAQCAGNPPGNNPSNSQGWFRSDGTPCTSAGNPIGQGQSCIARCNTGYTSVPAPTATCIGINQWSGVAPTTCSRVCTGMPQFQEQFAPEFLGWDPACADRTRVNGWCYGTCGAGYTGQPRIACASPSPGNSGWQSTAIVGKCVQANVSCTTKPLTNPRNGVWPETCVNHAPGMVCTSTCKVGYTSKPAPSRVCQADGTWGPISPSGSGPDGECKQVCGGMPDDDLLQGTGRWSSNCADSTIVGGSCPGVCADGYVGTPSILCSSPSVSPYKSGWTSQISGQCIRASATVNNVTCATKPDRLFNNGVWPDTCINSAVGASCIATCQVGYTTTPAPRVQCQPNGLWSQILEGSCDRVCPSLPDSSLLLAGAWNPACADSVRIGGTCSAQCPAGFNGAATVVCQSGPAGSASPEWSRSVTGIGCYNASVCPSIPTQSIANSDGWPASCLNTPIGGECAVTCKTGFTASQPKSVCREGATAGSPGVWATASPSTCVQLPTNCPAQPTATVTNGGWPNCTGLAIGANCTATCSPGFAGPATVTCLVTGLWSTTVAGACTSIDACQVTPCRTGAAAANCTDKPPPFGGDVDGRTCTCPPGYTYSEADGCQDPNECSPNPCGALPNTNGTCQPKGAPESGFSCGCNSGYIWNGTACADPDECNPNNCGALPNTDGSCQPKAAPESGYTCGCSPGYTWTIDQCADIDACQVTPCKQTGAVNATCEDGDPPLGGDAAGRTCTCASAAYTYTEANGCIDLNECGPNTCAVAGAIANTNGTCFDRPAPLTGFDCGCLAGFSWTGSICEEIESCSPNPCQGLANSNSTCFDQDPPLDGYSCACDTGYTWNGTACADTNSCSEANQNYCAALNGTSPTGGCVDLSAPELGFSCTCMDGRTWNPASLTCDEDNGCAGVNCGNGSQCVDNTSPQTGFTCQCADGTTFNGVTCVDIDACQVTPCKQTGAVNATCEDGDPPLGGDAAGRTCTCASAAYTYTEANGCIDLNECGPNTCAVAGAIANTNGTCFDRPAPLTGFDCGCLAGYSWTGSICEEIESCSPNPCQGLANSNSTCFDQDPPLDGYTCACDTGYTWNGTACADTNGCTPASINYCAALNGSEGCRDLPAPQLGFNCTCMTGRTWNAVNMTCDEDDGCAGVNCGPASQCVDNVSPATGYECICGSGTTFSGGSCIENNECLGNPCAGILMAAANSCTDVPAPGTGFNCNCSNSHVWDPTLKLCRATVCNFGPSSVGQVSDGSFPPDATLSVANGGCAKTPIGGTCVATCKEGFNQNIRPVSICQLRADSPAYTTWSAPVPSGCIRLTGRRRLLKEFGFGGN